MHVEQRREVEGMEDEVGNAVQEKVKALTGFEGCASASGRPGVAAACRLLWMPAPPLGVPLLCEADLPLGAAPPELLSLLFC